MTDRTTVDDARDASQWRVAVWGGAATLMILPVLAMRLAAPGERDLGDFIFLAILLGGVGLTYELAARMPDRHAFRLACAIAVAATLLNIWINLAVGIIGSEDNPANLIYFAVIAIAAAGAVVARFRPLGMARAMTATALAQLLVFAFALAAGLGFTGPITVFFTALWLLSAWLFRRAAGT